MTKHRPVLVLCMELESEIQLPTSLPESSNYDEETNDSDFFYDTESFTSCTTFYTACCPITLTDNLEMIPGLDQKTEINTISRSLFPTLHKNSLDEELDEDYYLEPFSIIDQLQCTFYHLEKSFQVQKNQRHQLETDKKVIELRVQQAEAEIEKMKIEYSVMASELKRQKKAYESVIRSVSNVLDVIGAETIRSRESREKQLIS